MFECFLRLNKNEMNDTHRHLIYFCKAADNSFASIPSFLFETSPASSPALGSSLSSTDSRRDSDLGLNQSFFMSSQKS